MSEAADLLVGAASLGDMDAVAALINRAIAVERFFIDGDRIDAAEVERLMQTGTFLIARAAGDRPCACVYVEPRGNRLYLGLLSVDPASQRKGLGRAMVRRAEDRARALGYIAVDIRVVSRRTELPPFYERLGYTACGTEPFVGNAEPARPCHFIRMTRALQAAAAVVEAL